MYIKTMENRKDLVKRIEQLTGERAVYTRMPECAFVIDEFKVERYGTLVFTEDAEQEVIDTLLAEGLIREYDPEAEQREAEAEAAESIEPQEPEPVAGSISLPLTHHTAASLRNLVAMVRARGRLISKATGGCFNATEDLMEALTPVIDIPAFLSVLESHRGCLQGLEITSDAITFTGFPEAADPERIQVFTQLAALMNRLALEQKHTLPRPVVAENEKYIFRIWLLRLGMAGAEYKTARRILLAPLSGNAAFKDEAMQERWKEKRKAAALPATPATVTINTEENPVATEDQGGTETAEETAP